MSSKRKIVGVSLSWELYERIEKIAKSQKVSPSAWCYEVVKRAANAKRTPVARERPNGLAGADEATKEEVSRAGVKSREKKIQKSSS